MEVRLYADDLALVIAEYSFNPKDETLVSARHEHLRRVARDYPVAWLAVAGCGMSDQEENDESPLLRLARLNQLLGEWTNAPTQSLSTDDARQLADAVEALLSMIDDIRGHPATRTPERLRALADAITALLADIAATRKPPH